MVEWEEIVSDVYMNKIDADIAYRDLKKLDKSETYWVDEINIR